MGKIGAGACEAQVQHGTRGHMPSSPAGESPYSFSTEPRPTPEPPFAKLQAPPAKFGTKRNVLADMERRSGGTLFFLVGPSGSGKTTLIDMAADVLKDCKCYAFVRNFATCEFPAPGASKRDMVVSIEGLQGKKAAGEAGHLWTVQGEQFALPPSKEVADLLAKNRNVVVDVPDAAVASLLLGDLFYAKVSWLQLKGFQEYPPFKGPQDAWLVDNRGTVVDGLFALVEAIRSQTVASTLPQWLSRPIASTEIMVRYYNLPARLLAEVKGSDQAALEEFERQALGILTDHVYGFECEGYIAEVEWQDLDGFVPQNIRVTSATKKEMCEKRFIRGAKCSAFKAVDTQKLHRIEDLKGDEDSDVQNAYFASELNLPCRHNEGLTLPISIAKFKKEKRVLSTFTVYPNTRDTLGFPKWKVALIESFVRGLREAHDVWLKSKTKEMQDHLDTFNQIEGNNAAPSICVLGPPGSYRSKVAAALAEKLEVSVTHVGAALREKYEVKVLKPPDPPPEEEDEEGAGEEEEEKPEEE